METVSEYGRKLISIAQETFSMVSLESLDEVLKENFIKGILDPRLRLKLEWKRRKMLEIKNQAFTINDLIRYAKVSQQTYDSENSSFTDEDKALQICEIRSANNPGPQETAVLSEVLQKVLNVLEAAEEREEKRSFFRSRNRPSYRNEYVAKPTQQRGFQGLQWTPHEGSQRWPYASQYQPQEQRAAEWVPHQASQVGSTSQSSQSFSQQATGQQMQGRPSTPPTAVSRQ